MTDRDQYTEGGNADPTDKVKAAAGAAAEDAKTQARDMADTVATEAGAYADQAKGRASDEVKDVAQALRKAADEMRSGSAQERTFSQIADSLADASDALRDRDLGEMVGAVNGFARRNPLAFLGSAALIGFAATRFAKASGDGGRQSSQQSRTGYRPAPYGDESDLNRQADGFGIARAGADTGRIAETTTPRPSAGRDTI